MKIVAEILGNQDGRGTHMEARKINSYGCKVTIFPDPYWVGIIQTDHVYQTLKYKNKEAFYYTP